LTVVDAVADWLAVSIAVTLITNVPAVAYVWVALGVACGPTTVPSPKLKL
jgi:hypothetical protein